MLSKTLSAGLALLVAAGVAFAAKADVTGSFDIDITLSPEGTQTEAVKFDIDLQSNLQVNVTLSGLTVGADLGFGVTGVEFAILSLNTNLGALFVSDDFVFAVPFGCTLFPAGVTSTSGGIVGACPGDQTIPINDLEGDGVVDLNDGVFPIFVKKRINLELNLAGVTLSNLALFEDVDFPDIQGINPSTGLNDHEHDHFDGSIGYHVNGINNDVDDQTPTYGFGDVLSISGQTVSGITVTGITQLCADDNNYIKKRSWRYEVNEACTASFGGSVPEAPEGGAKTPLFFEEEVLIVEGVALGGVTVDTSVTFRPLQPVAATVEASFSVLDLFSVTATFTSNNLTALSLSDITLFAVSGNLSFLLIDFGGDLDIDLTFTTLSTVLNPNQNPASLTIQMVTVGGVGIVRLDATLGVSRGAFSFSTRTRFASGASGPGSLDWASTTFSASVSGETISLDASLAYTPAGMGDFVIELGVVF